MTPLRFRKEAELQAAITGGTFAGRAVHVTVLHDDACTPSRCVCEPEFVVEEATPAVLAAGVRAQRAWEEETAS